MSQVRVLPGALLSRFSFDAGVFNRSAILQVKLLYFAIIREALGRSGETRTVEPGRTIEDLFGELASEQPALHRLRPSLMFMINEEYAKPGYRLQDGDELALIPPVSGSEARRFVVTADPVSEEQVSRLVASPAAGAIVTFVGTVRNNARGRTVLSLDYEAYPPAAERMLRQIGGEIRDRWGIEHCAIYHRMGHLAVGEASVAIAVASAHRGDAFDACRFAIDRIKEIVPIWKKEFYEDGETWVGSEADYQAAFGTSGRSSSTA
jgi:MoaE-MoaD fusion protein